MRRGAAIVIGAMILLGATACGQTVEEVEKDAHFVKVCEDSGGKVVYGFFGDMQCSFYKRAA